MPTVRALSRLRRRAWTLALAAVSIGGCAAHAPQSKWFPALRGTTETAFVARVASVCAAHPVGERTVGAVLTDADAFRQLTGQLYRGALSNDLYMEQVRVAYPAPDANLPAVGCVIAQLNACLGGRCAPPPATPPASG